MTTKKRLCENGCGKEAKYYIKGKNEWRCKKDIRQCDSYRKERFNKIVEIINKNGGICLTPFLEYGGYYSRVKIRCSHEHEWYSLVNNILRGKWCRECFVKKLSNSRSVNLNVLIKKAKEYDGKLLSTKYINNHTKYKWECSNGHIFESTWDNVRSGYWCYLCSRSVNIKEEMVRFAFQEFTGFKFLRTKKLFNGFEVDGYCKELQCVFEYNGEQHYRHHKMFHRGGRELKDQIKRDRRLRRKCKQSNIRLIVVPYRNAKSKEMIENYVKNKLIKNNIQINGEIKWDGFIIGDIHINQVINICEKKGGKLLTNNYLGDDCKIEILCSNGHVFTTTPGRIKQGMWCRKCGNINSSIKQRKKDGLQQAQQIANMRDGKCLSKEYVNYNTKLEFECKKGHFFKKSFAKLKRGQWCPNKECKRINKKIRKEELEK